MKVAKDLVVSLAYQVRTEDGVLKHGHVRRVQDWPYSTFHRDVRRGWYPSDWAGEVSEFDAGERR